MEIIIATIQRVGYGLRDFPDGKPGLWFSVNWGDGYVGALMAYSHDKAQEFILEYKIENVFNLNNKKCSVLYDGCVHFLSLMDNLK